MVPVQSWIGMFIQGVKFYSKRKAPVIIGRGKPVQIVHTGDENALRESSTLRCITEKWLCHKVTPTQGKTIVRTC